MKDELGRIGNEYEIEPAMVEVGIGIYREHPDAKMPEIAYGNSAAFDLYCVEDTVIPGLGNAMIPVGLRMTIPDGWYVHFATRSGHGIKKNLRVHPGVIDAGYAGPCGVKMFNLDVKDQVIKKGEAAVQCLVSRVPVTHIHEVDEKEFEEYREASSRGDKGFGSSTKV